MKKKKAFLLLISFGLSVFLISCSKAQDPENLFEIPVSEAQDIQDSSVSETDKNATPVLTTKYQYGNMQKNVPPGNFMDFGKQILFIASPSGQQILYTFDKETEEISLFCRDATCLHDSLSCVSAGVVSNLEQYNGKIYALNPNNEIMELKNGRFEKIVDGTVYNFWHADNNLYAVSRDGSLVVFEEGSKNPHILIDEYTDYWNVICDQFLYGCSSKGIRRVNLQSSEPEAELIVQGANSMIDGEYIYYMEDKTFHLYRCNMDGSAPVQRTAYPVLPASINFDETYLYFRLYTGYDLMGEDSHDVYRLSKENPESIEKICELENYVNTIYTVPDYERIFVETSDTYGAEAKKEYYLVTKDGSDIRLLEFPDFQ